MMEQMTVPVYNDLETFRINVQACRKNRKRAGKIVYTSLSALLRKPELYEKTPAKFWNDPHISGSMLATHLDPDTDTASRKPETIDRTVELILSLLPMKASLLDIGCGPGLYTRRLSKRGLQVTGLDFSARSIAWAREHDPDSEYIQQDYLQMDFDSRFDMVSLIWCDYGALVPSDRQNLLLRICKALKPGGLFLFDVFTKHRYDGFKDTASWEASDRGGFWSPDPYLCFSAQYGYEGGIGVSRYVILEEGNTRCFNIWDTGFTRESLTEELRPHGFIPAAFYSDAQGSPFDESSVTLCAVMRKGNDESDR